MNATKKAIIEATIELVNENGFVKTSMQDIATRAHLGKGTAYLYFASKEELFEEVYLYCQRLDVEASNRGLDAVEGTLDKLCLRMENAIRYGMAHPELLNIERRYLKSNFDSHGPYYHQQKMHYEYVNEIMVHGIERRELKQLPASLLGEIFYGIADAFLRYFEKDPERLDDEELWKCAKQCIRDCLMYQGG